MTLKVLPSRQKNSQALENLTVFISTELTWLLVSPGRQQTRQRSLTDKDFLSVKPKSSSYEQDVLCI